MEQISLKDRLVSVLRGRRGIYLIIITSILTILLLAYYAAVFSYHRNIFVKYNELVLQGEDADAELENACREDASLDSMYHELAFKKALLSMAQTDSAGLVISLPDSSMYLQIRGVKVFNTKMINVRLDRYAGQMGINAYLKNFGRTAKLTRDTCNYEKEPLIHIEAPDDTTEAKSIKHDPDTTISKPVKIVYWLDNDLKVTIDGLKPDADSFLKSTALYLADRIHTVHRFTINYFTGEEERYTPELFVELDNKDALIIYRALHARAPVVVYF
jgi:hypothetical protein